MIRKNVSIVKFIKRTWLQYIMFELYLIKKITQECKFRISFNVLEWLFKYFNNIIMPTIIVNTIKIFY